MSDNLVQDYICEKILLHQASNSNLEDLNTDVETDHQLPISLTNDKKRSVVTIWPHLPIYCNSLPAPGSTWFQVWNPKEVLLCWQAWKRRHKKYRKNVLKLCKSLSWKCIDRFKLKQHKFKSWRENTNFSPLVAISSTILSLVNQWPSSMLIPAKKGSRNWQKSSIWQICERQNACWYKTIYRTRPQQTHI